MQSIKFYPWIAVKIFSLVFFLALSNLSRAQDLTAVSAQNVSTLIEKQKNISHRDPLVLLHEKWVHRQLNVSAAYESPWQDSIILAKVSNYEHPGCAGIKASFTF